MGHDRLGTLPDTAPWQQVVQLLAEDAQAADVAHATTKAALRGLDKARQDEGLVFSVWILARTVFAARQPDFAAALRDEGIVVPDQPGVFDIIAGVAHAIDQRLFQTHGRTDIGEMAELAAVEALTALLGRRASTLFGTTPTEVRSAAYGLSTQKGFSTLAHELFARFAQRFLTYHLGRELSQHVGGNGRFADTAEHTEFVEQLSIHCREAAGIMHVFAGGWYSKHQFLKDMSLIKATDFTAHAIDKLSDELAIRGQRDG